MKESKEEKSKHDKFQNAAISGAAADTVQRYGAANKEWMVAYSGKDNEIGQVLKRSLKSISNQKGNKSYTDRAQRGGYAAETATEASENAERAIHGDKSRRTTRTDDINKQSDGKGNTIGGVNDPLYDLVDIDGNGNYIAGTGRQLKYVGKTPEECTQKLLGRKFDKYRENADSIEVPADYYEKILEELDKKTQSLNKQIENAEKKGNAALANKHREELQRIEKTKKKLKKGKFTKEEMMKAGIAATQFTAKEIAKISHRAGIEAAKEGAVVGGGISVIRNMVGLIKGDEDAETALVNVAKDTGTAMAVGYGTGFAGSVVKGAMQNAKSSTLRAASKTNLPAALVTTALSTGKTMSRFFKGEINGLECFEELGENGVTMIASSVGTVIGQAVIPIPIVGAVIGSMVGYAIASSSYGVLLESLKDAKLAHEERIRIEAECAEHINLIREYRAELEQNIDRYLSSNMAVFSKAFDDMKSALYIGDIDGFISGTNSITKALGKSVQFETMDEFDALMNSSNAFKI